MPDPHEIADLESDQSLGGSFWESVPVAVFTDPSRSSNWDDEEGNGNRRLLIILAAVGFGALMLVLFVALAVLLILRK